jgi:S1-C subfamily serine protease
MHIAKEARIVGIDFGVPTPTPQRQLCIYTDPVTNYGDSGGALVNDDDQLVGFSFQRTPFSSPTQYSTWIWAHSALEELDLSAI